MSYCLDREELRTLIALKAKSLDSSCLEEGQLKDKVNDAEIWQDEVYALTYLFSKTLLNEQKSDTDCEELIGVFYRIPDIMSLHIQSFDRDFVCYMLKSMRDSDVDLDTNMIQMQTHLSCRRYDEYYGLRYRH